MKDLKKTLLGLLLIPSLALTGCSCKKDDTPPSNQEGGEQEETPQQQETRGYALLADLLANLYNQNTKQFSSVTTIENKVEVTALDADKIKPGVEAYLNDQNLSEKEMIKTGYDLNNGLFYETVSTWNEENTKWDVNNEDYVVQQDGGYLHYYDHISTSDGRVVDSTKAQILAFGNKGDMKGNLYKQDLYKFAKDSFSAKTFATYKVALKETLSIMFNVQLDELPVMLTKEGNDYKLSGKIVDKVIGVEPESTKFNASLEMVFNSEGLKSLTINNSELSKQIKTIEDQEISLDVLESTSKVQVFMNTYDVSQEYLDDLDDFLDVNIYVNNIQIMTLPFRKGDSLIDFHRSLSESLNCEDCKDVTSFGYSWSDTVDKKYSFDVDMDAEKARIEAGKAYLVTKHYNTTTKEILDSKISLVDVDELNNEKFSLPNLNPYKVVTTVDGTVVDDNFKFSEKQVVVKEFYYNTTEVEVYFEGVLIGVADLRITNTIDNDLVNELSYELPTKEPIFGYYLDESCTIPFSKLEKIPNRKLTLYVRVKPLSIPQKKVLLVTRYYNSSLGYIGDVRLVRADDLNNDLIDFESLLPTTPFDGVLTNITTTVNRVVVDENYEYKEKDIVIKDLVYSINDPIDPLID